MRRAVQAASLLCFAAVQADITVELLWNQTEKAAVYSTAGISRHAGTTPTFSTATYLNQPEMVEAWNISKSSPSSGPMWQYTAQDKTATFQLAMARHADAFGTGAVDMVAAESTLGSGLTGTCTVYAWSSLGAASSQGHPAWTFVVPDCTFAQLNDASDMQVAISDDGATVCFSMTTQIGSNVSSNLWLLEGQTGGVRFNLTVDNTAAGEVTISESGAWVGWDSGNGLYVLDAATGSTRAVVPAGGLTAISSDASYLAVGGDNSGSVYAWDGASSMYMKTHTVRVPNPGPYLWLCSSVTMSSTASIGKGGELTIFAFTINYGANISQVQVLTVSTADGEWH